MFPALSPTVSPDVAAALGPLPRAELSALAGLSTVVGLPAGAVVFAEGDCARELVWVVSGALEVRSQGRTLAVLRAGDPAGELGVLPGAPSSLRSADVVVVEDAELAVVSRAELAALLDRCPRLAERLAERAAARRRSLAG